MLYEDIKVYSEAKDINIYNQIQISSGMEYANNQQYYSDAIIPISCWTDLSKEFGKILLNEGAITPSHKTVSLISIPNNCLQKLKKSELYGLNTYEEVFDFQKKIGYNSFINPVIEYLTKYLKTEDDLIITPLKIKKPNLITVSSELTESGEKFVGIHVDVFDKKPIDSLPKARNLICANLGQESRYLLFVNLSVAVMCKLLQGKSKENPEVLFFKQQLLDEFIRQYPNYPVIKLEIQPDQAYIAPIENIFHEGCTLGARFLDISLTLRGYFNATCV